MHFLSAVYMDRRMGQQCIQSFSAPYMKDNAFKIRLILAVCVLCTGYNFYGK